MFKEMYCTSTYLVDTRRTLLDRLDRSNVSQPLTVNRQEKSFRQLFDEGWVRVGRPGSWKRSKSLCLQKTLI